MNPESSQRLAEALKIMVPSDHLVAPGFVSSGRAGALAQAEAVFRRLSEIGDHGR